MIFQLTKWMTSMVIVVLAPMVVVTALITQVRVVTVTTKPLAELRATRAEILPGGGKHAYQAECDWNDQGFCRICSGDGMTRAHYEFRNQFTNRRS